MYTEQLLETYKKHKNFVQYKQVAHELGLTVQMLTEIRKGRVNLKENLALMIADEIGEEKETVLIGLAADKAKTPQEQALWANIAKKFNGRGLQGISMVCGGLAMWIGSPSEAIAKCALCRITVNRKCEA